MEMEAYKPFGPQKQETEAPESQDGKVGQAAIEVS